LLLPKSGARHYNPVSLRPPLGGGYGRIEQLANSYSTSQDF
jgi:hypothetical protein